MAYRTIATGIPQNADFPSTNFPQYLVIHSTERRSVLAFDAATVEGCRWKFTAPPGLTGALQAVIFYCAASGVSGKFDFEVSVEAVTPDDALDLDAAASFDTMNAGNEVVPGTAGYMSTLTIPLTNADSMAAGDLVWIKFERDADDGTDDTASGDAYVFAVDIQDSGG